MAAIVSIVSRCVLSIGVYRGNQPNESKLALYDLLLLLYQSFKAVISNKMGRFSYKDGCGVYVLVCILVHFKELSCATDKRLWVNDKYKMFYKMVIRTTKELKNKAFLKQYRMRCYICGP